MFDVASNFGWLRAKKVQNKEKRKSADLACMSH